MSLRPYIAAALAIAVCCGAAPGFSQTGNYPNRTIWIVVPFVPGGGVDTLARMFAEKMQPKLGVTVIVENRAGASGTVGGASVLQSPADGYTVLFSSNTHSMAKQVMSKPPYDPLTDFKPIARRGKRRCWRCCLLNCRRKRSPRSPRPLAIIRSAARPTFPLSACPATSQRLSSIVCQTSI